MRTAVALVRACHPGPTAAVTVLAALLAVTAGHSAGQAALVATAVLAGQLTVGWSNDLVDADRDVATARRDKPLVTGEITRAALRRALVLASAACVALSLAVGLLAGLVHLTLVAAAWAYNLGLKRTVWSWLPYVVAFGLLPAFSWLALDPPAMPPWWVMVVGSVLGFGAHLLNTLPDLDDDARTGVRGLPHRLGARRSSVLAVVALVAGTAVVVLGPAGTGPWWGWAVLAMSVLLSVGALVLGGRAPFRAALVIALLDVVLLVARS
ncbi:UbiA family prenyltransferase [Georgenia sp. Z1491]|uniref:UbiA family prenyltransferase n=1 Tax=Georgenia sp. Z1491 TaxID=3416707 RepID=UPI003CE8798A